MSNAIEEAQKLWNVHPCGMVDNVEYGSRAFFDEVRRIRYEVSDTWMNRLIDFSAARGKKLLEVGHGLGTDLLRFCEEGAEVYGIDVTEEHHRLAKLNFELHNKPCTLKMCGCTDIDFPADYFDYVYSHGVLHHVSNTVRCVSEIYRVLRPGGHLLLGVYHTYSAYLIFSMLLYQGLWKGNLRRLGYRNLLSTIETGADGITIKPLVKTYSKRNLKHILSDFSRVDISIAHFKRDQIPILGRFMPGFLEIQLESQLGWYLLARATK